jgi:hypothetical protein
MPHIRFAAVAVVLFAAGCTPAPSQQASEAPRPPSVEPPPQPKVAPGPVAASPAPVPPPVAPKAPATPSGKPAATKAPVTVAKAPAAAPPPAAPTVAPPSPSPPPLDLKSLESRLKDTSAIGVLTKLSLKNQVDDLIARFRTFHDGKRPPTLAELRPAFELLLMKVLSLLQDRDTALAKDINASRDAIWGVLADRAKLAKYA